MREVPGKWVILTIASLAVAGAGGAVWFHYAHGRRAAEYWGARTGALIAAAPLVEVWRLQRQGAATEGGALEGHGLEGGPALSEPAPDPRAAEILRLDGQNYAIVARQPLERARGFGNLRWAIGQDASYDWTATAADHVADRGAGGGAGPAREPVWEYALCFRRDGEQATLLFGGGDAPALALAGSAHAARLQRRIADGIRLVIDEQFAEQLSRESAR